VDAITAGVLLAWHTGRAKHCWSSSWWARDCAGAIILPSEPSLAAILVIGVVPLIAYPYWRDVRTFPSWWAGTSRALLMLAVLAGAALLVTAAIAFPRGTDPAARGGWWSDYAEHATVLALADVLATSRGPGWRILRGLCNAVWLYLVLVGGPVYRPVGLLARRAEVASLDVWVCSKLAVCLTRILGACQPATQIV
jgi:hypothetical protein